MPASASNPKVTGALNSMRMLLGAGLPIHRVLRNCGDVVGYPWRIYFNRASDAAEAGENFERCAEELKEVLPFTERVMLVIAWNSGRMDDILPKMIKRRENLFQTMQAFRRSMIQPVLTLLVAALVVPAPQVLLGQITPAEYVVRASLPLLVAVGLVLAVWLIIRTRTLQMAHQKMTDPAAPANFMDRVLFNTPYLHQMQVYRNTGEFCDLLGNLLFSGVRVDEAMRLTSVALPNGIYREKIARLAVLTRDGEEIRDTLAPSRMWPMGFVELVGMADLSGNLDSVLLARSEGYREEYDRSVRTLGKMISWGFYLLVCVYIIFHIFKIAMAYVGMINDAIPKGMG
jgi:type II secretory pathway component PulF